MENLIIKSAIEEKDVFNIITNSLRTERDCNFNELFKKNAEYSITNMQEDSIGNPKYKRWFEELNNSELKEVKDKLIQEIAYQMKKHNILGLNWSPMNKGETTRDVDITYDINETVLKDLFYSAIDEYIDIEANKEYFEYCSPEEKYGDWVDEDYINTLKDTIFDKTVPDYLKEQIFDFNLDAERDIMY